MRDEDLAVVVTVESEFEAETKAEAIRARGIEAAVTRNAPSWTGQVPISPTARGSSVLVHREDLERARSLLQQVISDSVDIDWDEVDVGEREDDLPLHAVNSMPPLAKVSFVVAAVLFLGSWAAIVLFLLLFVI
ncbi:MAG: hypothetical protein ACYSU7_04780 [Planctomycetota bacterium]|jgi:hypothetical protein